MTRSLILSLALFLPAPALASDLCAMAMDMEARIAERLGYPPSSACPEVAFALPVAGAVQRSQAGAYDPVTGRIDLAPDLDLATAYGQSFLLHELVHAAQYRAGRDRDVPCPAALEAEAYGEQADFLMEAGLSREAVLTRALGAQLGGCAAPEY
ncbi:MAG: hypothetical protein O9292_04295 [Rhodobacteraceae bacterium]|nr:hypothetical protein [Paracoccaceae bacterium]